MNLEPLASVDIQNLHQEIQKLYTLHNLDNFAAEALSIVNRLVPGDIPHFHLTRIQSHQVSFTFLPEFPGFAPDIYRIIERYFGEHPIAARMPQTLDGAYKISDFISQQEFHHLEGLYQQFLRPFGLEDAMIFFLPNPESWHRLVATDATLMGFSTSRPSRNFTERDRSVLNLLRPHLFQAYSNAQHYHQLQQDSIELNQSLNHLSLAIVDDRGQVKSIAPQAIIWLEIYFGKPINSHRLPDRLWAWIEHQITGFTKHPDLAKACLPLRIEQAGRELIIRLVVKEVGVRYLLLMEEKTLSLFNSLELLGLTQRETEVLFWIMQGKDNNAIAVKLSIQKSTICKHLENIYRKLEAKTRTEAIAQALEKLGFFHSLHNKPFDI